MDSDKQKAEAIVNFAVCLQKEQRWYADISPYGGYDVTVQFIDEIAFQQVERLKNQLSNDAIEKEVVKELRRRGHDFSYSKEAVCLYKDAVKKVETLRNDYENWMSEMNCYNEFVPFSVTFPFDYYEEFDENFEVLAFLQNWRKGWWNFSTGPSAFDSLL